MPRRVGEGGRPGSRRGAPSERGPGAFCGRAGLRLSSSSSGSLLHGTAGERRRAEPPGCPVRLAGEETPGPPPVPPVPQPAPKRAACPPAAAAEASSAPGGRGRGGRRRRRCGAAGAADGVGVSRGSPGNPSCSDASKLGTNPPPPVCVWEPWQPHYRTPSMRFYRGGEGGGGKWEREPPPCKCPVTFRCGHRRVAGAALPPPLPGRGGGPPQSGVCLGVRGFPRGSAAGSAVWAPGEGGQGYLKDRQPF